MSEKPTETGAIDDSRRHVFTKLELREDDSSDDGPTKLVGHAAVFNTETDLGWFRETIAPGAFTNAIKTDDVRALFNHNPDLILGRLSANTLRLWEDDRGLGAEIDVPDSQIGRDVTEAVKRGDVTQMSFAFQPIVQELDDSGDVPLRTLKEVKLFDVSPVTYPAYPTTDISARSAYDSVTPAYLIEAREAHNAAIRKKIDEGEEQRRADREAETVKKAEVIESKRRAKALLESLK